MYIDIEEYKFKYTQLLDGWDPPSYGGVYAITFENEPGRHLILYFGQTDNFSERRINSSHESYECWKDESHQKDLYVSIYQENNKETRIKIEEQLIKKYNLKCNKT